MKTSQLLLIYFLTGVCSHPGAIDFSTSPQVNISASNELRFANGYDINGGSPRPWNYLVNTSDIRAGAGGFYLKTRFDVEEPSLGYNPDEPVYREYFSRRTVGLNMNPFLIEAGHVGTQFGRGLTLSCREDRQIERYSLLDGVYGQLRHPHVTLQAVAGRPIDLPDRQVELLDVEGSDEYTPPDTVLVLDQPDARFRDLVAGLYTEAFFPVDKAPFSFFSSGSIGGGLVRYSSNVGPVSRTDDPLRPERPFWYQNRTVLYLPSLALNLARGDYGMSMEHAWMRGAVHRQEVDSVRGAFDSVFTRPKGFSSYLSINAQILGVALLAEYKNYYYRRWERMVDDEIDADMFDEVSDAYKNVSQFFIPPSVRYQHAWHLLNKHLPSNLMSDVVGYKFMLNWAPGESSMLTADFSFGGRHDSNSRVRLKKDNIYWETYGEWAQEVGERFNLKIGFDYGKLDPDNESKVTFRTLACDLDAGPFLGRHSFGLVLEGQLNDKPFLAEKDADALMDLILRTVPQNILAAYDTYEDTLELADHFVPDSERSRYRQYALNLLATVSYHLAGWLSLAVTLEHEAPLDIQDNLHNEAEIVKELRDKSRNYASVGINLRPFPNHSITLEYGSMSGGKKCTLGTCVDIPPYKGFRLTINSML